MRSTRRFVALDAMRGVAALVVVLHHAVPMTWGINLLPRGYLAVDFFFMLSGFVLTRRFEPDFARGLGVGAFMQLRLRRLYPMMAAGILLGALVAIVDGDTASATLPVLLAALIFVPSLGSGPFSIFPLDGVQWSLMLELLANSVHATTLFRLRTATILVLVGATLGCLLLLTVRWGCLAVGDIGETVAGGVPRVFFSYLIGIALGRARLARRSGGRRPGMVGVNLLLALALVVPGLTPGQWPAWLVDLAVTALVFPLLIAVAAGVESSARAARIAGTLGAASYPLYAMHVPAIRLATVVWGGRLGGGTTMLAACLVSVAASAGGAWLLLERVVPRLRRAWAARGPGVAIATAGHTGAELAS